MNWRLVLANCCCTRSKYAGAPLTYHDMAALLQQKQPRLLERVFTGPHELETLFTINSWLAQHIFEDCDEEEDSTGGAAKVCDPGLPPFRCCLQPVSLTAVLDHRAVLDQPADHRPGSAGA